MSLASSSRNDYNNVADLMNSGGISTANNSIFIDSNCQSPDKDFKLPPINDRLANRSTVISAAVSGLTSIKTS